MRKVTGAAPTPLEEWPEVAAKLKLLLSDGSVPFQPTFLCVGRQRWVGAVEGQAGDQIHIYMGVAPTHGFAVGHVAVLQSASRLLPTLRRGARGRNPFRRVRVRAELYLAHEQSDIVSEGPPSLMTTLVDREALSLILTLGPVAAVWALVDCN